jgi:hypothetical protein
MLRPSPEGSTLSSSRGIRDYAAVHVLATVSGEANPPMSLASTGELVHLSHAGIALADARALNREWEILRTEAESAFNDETMRLPAAVAVPSSRRGQTYRLSVVVPVYNEQATVGDVIADLLGLDIAFDMEVIVVDDGSNDATESILSRVRDPRVRVIRHESNRGKGEALRTGILAATGTHMLPFDADSEYDAADIPRLMAPVLRGRANVVYGARIAGMNTLYTSFWYPVGSWATTWMANFIFASRLKDLHTCLKLLPLAVVREMPLREAGFGLDTELTARMLKMGLRPFEVPVSYRGRSHAQGKKISWRDGVRCLQVLFRVKFSKSAPSVAPDVIVASADSLVLAGVDVTASV